MFSPTYLRRLNEQKAAAKNPLRVEAEKDETATLVFSVLDPKEPKAIAHEVNGVSVTKLYPNLYFWCPKCGKVYEKVDENNADAEVDGFCRNDAPEATQSQKALSFIERAIRTQRGL